MLDMIVINTGLDDFSVMQIIVMSGVCSFMVSQRIDGWMTPILCTVGLFASTLVSNMACRAFGLIVTANKQIDGVFFSMFGLVAAAVALLVVRLTLSSIFNVARTSVQELREQERLRRMDRTL